MAAEKSTSSATDADAPPSAPGAGPGRWAGRLWAPAVWLLTVLLHTVAFPPFDLPEAAYVFAVPALLWSARRSVSTIPVAERLRRSDAGGMSEGRRPFATGMEEGTKVRKTTGAGPSPKTYLSIVGSASFVSWLVLLEWLHHVTVFGTIALAAVVSLFTTAWFAAVYVAMPRMRNMDAWNRLAVALGLAGLWVLLEWFRSWILTGFPWLPLAASQWQRPIMLQSAAYGGAWAVSFSLVIFNVGLAAYFERLRLFVSERKSRWCPEFYLGLFVLFIGSFGLYRDSIGQQRETLFRAGFMQPYIPQTVKWDPAEASGILEIIKTETTRLNHLDPDVIFWPEAVMPVAVLGNRAMQAWVENLSRELEVPIVLGGVGYEPSAEPDSPDESGRWSNAVFVVDPELRLQAHSYAKRHLVPFGEYVPLRKFLPFVEKFVPIGGDFTPGADPAPLVLRTPDRTTYVGALLCYEDVFPSLARATVRAGAQILFVATNNAWYGERGAAYQHAAHSVLRAVETRRPVLRTGNGGWSGWIDEFGVIRAVLLDEERSIYFRGSSVHEIDRDRRWVGRESFYVRWGDWLVWLSAAFVALGAWVAHASDRPRW